MSAARAATDRPLPDDPGLAIERTRLAWSRSALAIAAAGALVMRMGGQLGAQVPAYVAGGLLLAAAIAAWAYGRVGYRRHRDGFSDRRYMAKPRALGVMATATALTAVVSFALALLSLR